MVFVSDRDIVAAIIAGDPAGLSAAYDSYAAGLYGYCRSLLGEPADAADAVQDTFVIAAVKVSGLRNPARFRSWLYAVARNECHGRLRARARQADLDQAGEMTDEVDSVVGFAQRDELRRLMTDAIAGLNPGDREVIELNLRHDLAGADLAGVLGVPAGQAHALASRARAQLERALGALLVARTGRRDCIELDAILDSWDGRLTALWRKRVSRHIESCDICSARKREVLSPAMLLSVLPLVPLPAGLGDHLMRLVGDDSAEAAGYRGRVVGRAGAFDPAGFPVQIAPAAATGRSGRGPGAGGAGGSGPAAQAVPARAVPARVVPAWVVPARAVPAAGAMPASARCWSSWPRPERSCCCSAAVPPRRTPCWPGTATPGPPGTAMTWPARSARPRRRRLRPSAPAR